MCLGCFLLSLSGTQVISDIAVSLIQPWGFLGLPVTLSLCVWCLGSFPQKAALCGYVVFPLHR